MKNTSRNVAVIAAAIFAVVALSFAVKEVRDAYGPVAEFDSVQEVADNITEFYSVVLDRQDIAEGEFTLDVYPGKKIVVYGTALPATKEYTIEGERKVRQYRDKAFVTTDGVERFVELSFAQSFEVVTSTLYMQYGGEEIALPINVGISPITTTLSGDAGKEVVQRLQGLSDDGSYEYVLSVGSGLSDSWYSDTRYLSRDDSYLIAVALANDLDAVSVTWMLLPELPSVLRDIRWGVFQYQDNIADRVFFEIARENERYQEILDILYGDRSGFDHAFSRMSVAQQDTYIWEAAEACRELVALMDDSTACQLELIEEVSNLRDAMKEQAEQLAKDTDEYKRIEAFRQMSGQEQIAETVEHIVFTVQAEVESIDGIDVSG